MAKNPYIKYSPKWYQWEDEQKKSKQPKKADTTGMYKKDNTPTHTKTNNNSYNTSPKGIYERNKAKTTTPNKSGSSAYTSRSKEMLAKRQAERKNNPSFTDYMNNRNEKYEKYNPSKALDRKINNKETYTNKTNANKLELQQARIAQKNNPSQVTKEQKKVLESSEIGNTGKVVRASMKQVAGGDLKALGYDSNRYNEQKKIIEHNYQMGKITDSERKKQISNLDKSGIGKAYKNWESDKSHKFFESVYKKGQKLNEQGDKEYEKATKGSKGLEKAYFGAVNAGVGMLADMAAGPAWWASMATRTLGNNLGDTREKGTTQLQDARYAALQALKEVGTEMMFAGAGLAKKMVSGKALVSGADKLADLLTRNIQGQFAKNVVGTLTKALGGAVEENLEEVAGWGLDPQIANISYGNELQKKNEDDIRTSIQSQLAGLDRNEMNAIISSINSDAYIDNLTKAYIENGAPKDVAQNLALQMREYMAASLSGDTESAKNYENALVETFSGLNPVKETYSLSDLKDTLASTTLLTLATGLPMASVETSQGQQMKDALGKEGVKALTETAINFEDDAISVRAQAMRDSVNNGGDLSGIQVGELSNALNQQYEKDAQRQNASNQAAQKLIKEDGSISPISYNRNGDIEYIGKKTAEIKAENDNNVAKVIEDSKVLESLPEEKSNAIGQAVSNYMTGVLTVGDANELTATNVEARQVFELATGEKLPTILDKAGNIDIVKTNTATKEYLFQNSAKNLANTAKAETANFYNEQKPVLDKDVMSRLGASGQTAYVDITSKLDIRNTPNYMINADAIATYYSAGRNSSFENFAELQRTVVDNPVFAGVSLDARKQAFNAGLEDKYLAQTKAGAVVKQGETKVNTSYKGKGEIYIETENIKNDDVELFNSLAKGLNVNIHIVDNLPTSNGGQANGIYKDGEIWLNVNETTDRNIGYVFMHEVTHYIKDNAPEQFNELEQMVRNAWFEFDNNGMQQAIKQKIDLYKANGQTLTEAEAMEEILADATYEMLQDEEFANQVSEENPSLARAILDGIRSALRKLREMFATKGGFTPRYNAGLLSTLDILKEAEQLWLNALHVATKNKADGFIAENNATRMSVQEDSVNDFNEKSKAQYYKWMDKSIENQDNNYKNQQKIDMLNARDHFDMYEEFYKETQSGVANKDNFMKNTMARFQKVSKRPNRKPDYVSKDRDFKVSSEYWYTEDGVIRGSNHWGNGIASCDWVLMDKDGKAITYGKDEYTPANTNKYYGKANWEDFLYKTTTATVDGKQYLRNFDTQKDKDTSTFYGVDYFYNTSGHEWQQDYSNERFSISEQQDTDYLQAVESGDMEKAQQMVDEAAKRAGYEYDGYHGSIEKFTVFKKNWNYFSSNENVADTYKGAQNGNKYHVYIKMRNPYVFDANYSAWSGMPVDEELMKQLQDYGNGVFEEDGAWRTSTNDIVSLVEDLRDEGENYDGVIIKNVDDTGMGGEKSIIADDYILFNSNNAKSADPVTYDDNGNVIPLSERFNTENEDIRYSIVEDSQGRELSPGQKEFYAKVDSHLLDENGRLKRYYHGTDADFDAFDESYISDDNKLGIGFYLSMKPLKNDYKNTISAYANIENPITDSSSVISKENWDRFCNELGINTKYSEGNDEDMYVRASDEYTGDKKIFLDKAIEILGIDGIISNDRNTVVAFRPNQIKDIDNENPTDNPDKRFSLPENNVIPYSETQIKQWDNSKKIVAYKNVEQLKKFIQDSLDNKIFNKKMYFGIIPDSAAEMVLNKIGIDIKGKNIALGADEIRKIINSHGSEYEYLRGQKPVEPNDFIDIVSVISNPTRVESGGTYRNRPVINFIKESLGRTTVVTYDSKRSNDIRIQTMYINIKKESLATMTDEQASVDTPEAVNGTASLIGYNIPQDDNDVKYSIPTEDEVLESIAENQTEFDNDIPRYDRLLEESRQRRQNIEDEVKAYGEKKHKDTVLTHDLVLNEKSVSAACLEFTKTIMQNSEYVNTHGRNAQYNKDVLDFVKDAEKKMFAEYKAGKYEELWNTAFDTAAWLNENITIIDDERFNQYLEFRDYFRTQKIYVPDNIKSDFSKGYGAFLRYNMGRLVLTNDPSNPTIDMIWDDAVERFGRLLEIDLVHPVDMLEDISNTMDSLEDYTVAYESEEAYAVVQSMAVDLIDICMDQGEAWHSFADRKKAQYDMQTKRLKERHKEAMRAVREKQKEKIQEVKEYYKERKQKAKAVRERASSFENIKENYNWLASRLIKPSADKHIPEAFKGALANLLQQLDLQTEKSKALEKKFGKSNTTLKLLDLRKQLENIAGENATERVDGFEYDGYVFELLDALENRLEGKPIDLLEDADLKAVDTLLAYVRKGISNYNKAFDEHNKEKISDYGQKTISELDNKNKARKRNAKKYKGVRGFMDNILNFAEVTPIDFFEEINGGLYDCYKGLRLAFDKHEKNMAYAKNVLNDIFGKYATRKFINIPLPGSEIEKWSAKESEREFTLENGSSIKLTTAQVMALHCLWKREQARGHILGEGIIPSNTNYLSRFRKNKSQEINVTPVLPTANDITNIIATLTDEQRDIADRIQNFINTVVSAWGNDTSMIMYGYKKFVEKNYFPIAVSRDFVDLIFDENGNLTERIKNFGFTKDTLRGAKNPIIIGDFFDIISNHIAKMSMYNAYVPALTDFERVYNYKMGGNVSVKSMLTNTYGDNASIYIKNFIDDLEGNNITRKDGIKENLSKMLGKVKRASIGANIRVFLQQPTAIARAFDIIDPKYFAFTGNPKRNMQEMFEYCPIAEWKAWGNFQIDMTRDLRSIIMNKDWSVGEKLTMDMYGFADNVTWAKIWGAVRNEIKAKHPNVEYGSQEFWDLCNERMSYIVDKTQVVDSPFHRSNAMRDNDLGNKLVTSFMAEPTRTFNMVRSDVIMAKNAILNGDRKRAGQIIGRITSVYITSVALTQLLASLGDTIRDFAGDDDDDKDFNFFERWLDYFMDNYLGIKKEDGSYNFDLWYSLKNGNIWFHNNIYIIGSVKELADYGSSVLALKGLEELSKTFNDFERFLKGDPKVDAGDLMFKATNAISILNGIPFKNAVRDTKSVFNLFCKILGIDFGSYAADGTETKLFDFERNPIKIENGSPFDNFLNHFGINLTEEERKEREFNAKVDELESKYAGITGEELDHKLWGSVNDGINEVMANCDLDTVRNMRNLYLAAGGNPEYADACIKKNMVKNFKKTIGVPGREEDMQKFREYLQTTLGVTDAELSRDIVYSSEMGKKFKAACKIQDVDMAVEALTYLYDAGIRDVDVDRLWENRNSGDVSKYLPQGSTGTYVWPVDGEISSNYGYRDAPTAGASTYHQGIDIGARSGANVGASDGGEVIYADYDGGYGYTVGIKHKDGTITQYSHLKQMEVYVGDTVTKSQTIGKVGSTGTSTGPHLHFAVLNKNGEYVNPMKYLK